MGILLLGGPVATTRILIAGYGQSNMDVFFSGSSGSPPAAVAGTSFYDPAIPGVTTVPAADGIRILQNAVTTVTGLPTLSINGAVGGSTLDGLVSGTAPFIALVDQILANIRPADQVFFLWDHGESDSAGSVRFPDDYAPQVVQLYADLEAAVGRTAQTAPWIIGGKGTVHGADGTPFFPGNATQLSWSLIVRALKSIVSLYPGAKWFNQYDYIRGFDGLHYATTGGTALGGARFARYITNFMGATSGDPVFEIASATVVDATHTTLSVPLNLGTDWAPTTGAAGTNGVEISGDNGKTWVNADHSHASATAVTLTHTSLSTTNARLVRYLYGATPPDTIPTGESGPDGLAHPPTNMIFDNSALTIPLSPTTWPIRATGLTTLPMPTWRDIVSLNGNGHTVQTKSGIQLGPEAVRKYLVLALAGPTLSVSNMTITPQDFRGNNVGTPVVLTSPLPLTPAGLPVSLYGIALNSDNQNATTFSLSVTYSGDPFAGTLVQNWTIPYADLSSTTPTGANHSTTPLSTTGTTSLTVSAGGLVIAAAFMDTNQSASTSYSFSGTDAGSNAIPMALRWLVPQVIPSVSGDGAGVQTSGTASVTVNLVNSGTVDLAAVAWR